MCRKTDRDCANERLAHEMTGRLLDAGVSRISVVSGCVLVRWAARRLGRRQAERVVRAVVMEIRKPPT